MGIWKNLKEGMKVVFFPVWLLWIFIREFCRGVSSETRRIVILGCQGSGKTELWCRLRGIPYQEKGPGTGSEQMEEFELGRKEDGTPVIVLTTKDIGGGEQWVKDEYDNLINEDGTYIFYLINLKQFEEEKKENQIRLTRIASIIKKKQFEKCGLRLVATFYDKCGKNKKEAQAEVQSMFRDIKMMKKSKASEIPVEVINTTNDNDVEIIKKEILKSLES